MARNCICYLPVDPSARFCVRCGAPQQDDCPACGREIPLDSPRCPRCAAPLRFCPRCRKLYRPTERECTNREWGCGHSHLRDFFGSWGMAGGGPARAQSAPDVNDNLPAPKDLIEPRLAWRYGDGGPVEVGGTAYGFAYFFSRTSARVRALPEFPGRSEVTPGDADVLTSPEFAELHDERAIIREPQAASGCFAFLLDLGEETLAFCLDAGRLLPLGPPRAGPYLTHLLCPWGWTLFRREGDGVALEVVDLLTLTDRAPPETLPPGSAPAPYIWPVLAEDALVFASTPGELWLKAGPDAPARMLPWRWGDHPVHLEGMAFSAERLWLLAATPHTRERVWLYEVDLAQPDSPALPHALNFVPDSTLRILERSAYFFQPTRRRLVRLDLATTPFTEQEVGAFSLNEELRELIPVKLTRGHAALLALRWLDFDLWQFGELPRSGREREVERREERPDETAWVYSNGQVLFFQRETGVVEAKRVLL